MEFASAASALKHTYKGDVNFSSVNEFLGILNENITVLLVTNLKS
ncbi:MULTISPECIES: hypothetical protein [Flavobacteriaceae]|uniref:Uncharacterized protein n=1 Tax=Lutibacter litoralis TaxID=321268 RepID=A0ABV5JYK4_9FLAO|nr:MULTISPECIES: hypothetical protein [Flavobacteriaceae]GGK50062.1 hypothetical protein GCM10007963_18070 [Lutibacter litoralis]